MVNPSRSNRGQIQRAQGNGGWALWPACSCYVCLSLSFSLCFSLLLSYFPFGGRLLLYTQAVLKLAVPQFYFLCWDYMLLSQLWRSFSYVSFYVVLFINSIFTVLGSLYRLAAPEWCLNAIYVLIHSGRGYKYTTDIIFFFKRFSQVGDHQDSSVEKSIWH